MPKTYQLGTIQLGTDTILCDPGYSEDTVREINAGCVLSECMVGTWSVEMTEDMTSDRRWGMPKVVRLVHDGLLTPLVDGEWTKVMEEIGGDSGMIGVYDLARFHDASVVPPDQTWSFDGQPADPSDLWYSYVCELVGRDLAKTAWFGVTINWDGGMDLMIVRRDGRIVAIQLSISGWPDHV